MATIVQTAERKSGGVRLWRATCLGRVRRPPDLRPCHLSCQPPAEDGGPKRIAGRRGGGPVRGDRGSQHYSWKAPAHGDRGRRAAGSMTTVADLSVLAGGPDRGLGARPAPGASAVGFRWITFEAGQHGVAGPGHPGAAGFYPARARRRLTLEAIYLDRDVDDRHRRPRRAAQRPQAGPPAGPGGIQHQSAGGRHRAVLTRLDPVGRSYPNRCRGRPWRCELFLSSCGRGPRRGVPHRWRCLRCAATG